MTHDEIRNRYVYGLDLLPRHMHGCISRYMESGIWPGDFLYSMLTGRTADARTLADEENRAFEKGWAEFIANYLPDVCRGSMLKVAAWVKMGGLEGYPESRA